MSDSVKRDLEVFSGALQLPAGERAAYLEHACCGDYELRRRVEMLLAAHDRIGNFLDYPKTPTSLPGATGDKP
ncbi:MAG: hypothetical protein ABSE48_03840, partial [Verrucomicrobiota bacterium]